MRNVTLCDATTSVVTFLMANNDQSSGKVCCSFCGQNGQRTLPGLGSREWLD